MYASKFTGGIPSIKAFMYANRGLIAILAEMGLAQMLGAYKILKILNVELDSSA